MAPFKTAMRTSISTDILVSINTGDVPGMYDRKRFVCLYIFDEKPCCKHIDEFKRCTRKMCQRT